MNPTLEPAFWAAIAAELREHGGNQTPAPKSATEVLLAMEARVGGMHASHSTHGYLIAGRTPRSEEDELQHLVATLLAALSPAKRATLIRDLLHKRINRSKPVQTDIAKAAKRLLKAVRWRTDTQFKRTPKWKPRS